MGFLHFENLAFKTVKKIVIFVVGMSTLLVGVAFLFMPGPAIVVIPVGLAILATEFVWARRLLRRLKTTANNAVGSWKRNRDPE